MIFGMNLHVAEPKVAIKNLVENYPLFGVKKGA